VNVSRVRHIAGRFVDVRLIGETLAEPPEGLTKAETARRSGLGRATLHRVASGAVAPSLDTLRELAILHGLDLQVGLMPLSDPAAAAATRRLLEEPVSAEAPHPEVERWMSRLRRLAPGGDPVELARVGARAASLLHREGAVFLRGDADALRLASAGDATGGFWAVSGRAMLEMGMQTVITGPSVLWVEDVERAAELLGDGRPRMESARNAHVIIAESDPSILTDAFTVGGVRYVAPVQMVLDCIGLGGQLEQRATEIAEEWSR
jgi:transcriptional regulator with XRE-family HTH domain